MSYNQQHKVKKRTLTDLDSNPGEIKRRKCERDINAERHLKSPTSANDRLKLLRNSLQNPSPNLTDAGFGWKPPSLTATKGSKQPQVIAKRQYLKPVARNPSQSSASQGTSSIVKQLQPCKSSNGASGNTKRNHPQQFSMKDRLKVSKVKGPYSTQTNRRLSSIINSVSSTSAKTSECNINKGSNKSRDFHPSSRASNSNIFDVDKTNNLLTSYESQLPYQNACSNITNSDMFSKSNTIDNFELLPKSCSSATNSIFGNSTKNEISFERTNTSKYGDVNDKFTNPNSNLVNNAHDHRNTALGKGTFFGEPQSQRFEQPKIGGALKLSPTFPQTSDRKSLCTKGSNANRSINFLESANQLRNEPSEMERIRSPNNCDTPFVNKYSNNTNTSIFNNSNFEDNSSSSTIFRNANPEDSFHASTSKSYQFQKRQNIFPNSPISITTPAKTPTRKISIQDRLKKVPSAQNNANIVNTIVNSKSPIKTLPNNIFDATRNNTDIEPEPMEWADVDITEVIQNVENLRRVQRFPPKTQSNLQHMLNANNAFAEKYQNSREDCNERDYYIVVDTNVFLSELGIIKEILNINVKDNKKLYIYLPWMVIQELDYFKDSRCGTKKLQPNARKAILLLNECLGAKGSHVKAQLVTDALEAKSIGKDPDDIILACCLQAKERNHIVLLLSNDTNLRNKAIINKISAYSTTDILEKLKFFTDKSAIQINVEQIELRTSILLSVVVHESLRDAYGDIIDQMSVKKPPYTLFYSLELIRKYWVSVFSSLLQKQCLNTIDKLYDLLSQKNYTGLPEFEDKSKFVDLTLTLCMFLKTSFSQHSDNIAVLVNYIHSSTGRKK